MNLYARIVLLACLSSPAALAGIVGADVDIHEDVLDGKSWGLAGPYEKLIGTLYFEVDPENPANQRIVDIEHAPTNSDGNVEFSSNFVLLKPKQAERGNGTVIVGVANRGTRRMLTFFNHGSDEHEQWDAVNPTTAENFGDGFLMQQGYTLLWVGWQFDVPLSRPVRLAGLRAPSGSRMNPLRAWCAATSWFASRSSTAPWLIATTFPTRFPTPTRPRA